MFGIPLQQKWDYFVLGERAPDYYLLSDAALYYYSFVDAAIAMEYKSLSDAQKARVDPMITGFNATDIYAANHIRRVLLTFPGVFSGIGEFGVNKVFVTAKVGGHTASLLNPALNRIFDAVAPADWSGYSKTHEIYQPRWERLNAGTRAQVKLLNYGRVFDEAVPRIRE